MRKTVGSLRKTVGSFAFLLVLIFGSKLEAQDKGQHLNQPPPPAARELVKRAVLLAESDKPWAAIAALKKALSLAPNYLQAHIEYGNVKANYLNRSDEVEAEYRSLIRRFPRNPVYHMAFYFRFTGAEGQKSLRKVVELAPEWAWGHYARALLINGNDPEGAVVELQHCLESDGSALRAYTTLIEWQETRRVGRNCHFGSRHAPAVLLHQVQQREQEDPHNIHKVPVQARQF